mmetsp:Transcript_150516/g.483890  ORF Transcript_150516/g.483890 Transcript_150516/m.483890 type:complete len:260 (+) Transcript_150516:188-967(+)
MSLGASSFAVGGRTGEEVGGRAQASPPTPPAAAAAEAAPAAGPTPELTAALRESNFTSASPLPSPSPGSTTGRRCKSLRASSRSCCISAVACSSSSNSAATSSQSEGIRSNTVRTAWTSTADHLTLVSKDKLVKTFTETRRRPGSSGGASFKSSDNFLTIGVAVMSRPVHSGSAAKFTKAPQTGNTRSRSSWSSKMTNLSSILSPDMHFLASECRERLPKARAVSTSASTFKLSCSSGRNSLQSNCLLSSWKSKFDGSS